MKVIEAINRIDEALPNGYTVADKLGWLSELDGRVKLEIIDTHHHCDDIDFNPMHGYKEEDEQKELLIPRPYDSIYLHWLEACIHYANQEYSRYNNSMEMFNEKFSAFRNQYNSVHMPKGVGIRYW